MGSEMCIRDRAEGVQVAERLRAVVAGMSVWCAGILLRITVSVGVVGVDSASVETLAELMDAADQALYAAKDEGRDRVCIGRT